MNFSIEQHNFTSNAEEFLSHFVSMDMLLAYIREPNSVYGATLLEIFELIHNPIDNSIRLEIKRGQDMTYYNCTQGHVIETTITLLPD